MKKRVFVAMPYGKKEGIDFNTVYEELIKPALVDAGFDVFRADEEISAGNIRNDMFQELLLADLVVADLSIDNPNVWYELGVRHALRARGVIQIKCKRDYMPFNVYTDRTLSYHVKRGKPDPEFLEQDRKKIADMAVETLNSWYGKKISPVYKHLLSLNEPDWKSLRVDGSMEFWNRFEKWQIRIKIAGKKHKPGDIRVLVEEAPTRTLELESFRMAGKELLNLGSFSYALEQTKRALEVNPDDLKSQQQKALLLGRLGKSEEASGLLEQLVKKFPEDSESRAYLGRLRKERWLASWRDESRSSKEMKKLAANENSLLNLAIKPYEEGYKYKPLNYYSGINAVTLRYLLQHLTGEISESEANSLKEMEGGIRWACKCEIEKATVAEDKYWALVTLADLSVLSSDADSIAGAYQDAVAVAGDNWFALDSTLQQLSILKDLGFRKPEVSKAIEILEKGIGSLKKPWTPGKIFLFSGHMIDHPDRESERFPPRIEDAAAKAIAEKLKELEAGPDDLAMCGGACGGDLLFAEAAVKAGLKLELRIPFEEPKFLTNSVSFAGENWRERFYEVKKNADTSLLIMPDELGETPEYINPYERNNLWQLYTALAWGPENVHFICLWNGEGGDGPGGTKHMYDSVSERSGYIYVLDTNTL